MEGKLGLIFVDLELSKHQAEPQVNENKGFREIKRNVESAHK